MTTLPAAIEQLLKNSGFATTELLVLRHLLTGEPLTLRELAAKTGKSTGVLDLATRKLLERHIAKRVRSNHQLKYTIHHLEALSDWLHEKTEEQIEELRRQEECLASYVRAQEQMSRHPDMQYFEGDAGMAMAMSEVHKRTEKEVLCFLPMNCREEEDELQEVRRALANERKRTGVHLRIIAPNTPLGRRFQARDPFECRTTVLVDPSHFPLALEKVIGGNTVATFNHGDERAFLLTCPELAESERCQFNTLWKHHAPLTNEPQTLAREALICDTPPACLREASPSCSPATTKKRISKVPLRVSAAGSKPSPLMVK